jgi:hypothetical protein
MGPLWQVKRVITPMGTVLHEWVGEGGVQRVLARASTSWFDTFNFAPVARKLAIWAFHSHQLGHSWYVAKSS